MRSRPAHRSRHVTALYALHEGAYVPYILDAPAFVRERFRALFAAGVPEGTPLIVRSGGPATPDAAASDQAAPGDFAACLRGELAPGFSLVVHEGGSVDALVACAGERGASALYALQHGAWVPYILGAPALVNEAFRELFAGGVPHATPLVARSG